MSHRAGVHYTLTDASPADTTWLETLRRNVYQELFQLTWGGWDEARHQRHFAACLEQQGISIIHINQSPVGMLQLFEQEAELQIAEIQISPTQQNLGIGTQVLQDITARGDAANKDVRLRVGLQNLKACRLYERLGFVVENTSDTHYRMVRFPERGAGALWSVPPSEAGIAMTADEVLIDRIRVLVKRREGVDERKMFGGVAFMVNGNMAVGTSKGSLIVRLDKASNEKNLSHTDVREFDATGRVMKGWVMVDPDGIIDSRSLDEWIIRGIAYARTLPPKGADPKTRA